MVRVRARVRSSFGKRRQLPEWFSRARAPLTCCPMLPLNSLLAEPLRRPWYDLKGAPCCCTWLFPTSGGSSEADPGALVLDLRTLDPAESVEAIAAAVVAVVGYLEPGAPVRRAVRGVGGVAVVGLVQVYGPDREFASSGPARKTDNRVPVDQRSLPDPGSDAAQVPRDVHVFAVGGLDRNE